MLNLLLLLGIIILVLPWPLEKTLRRLCPVIGIATVVVLATLAVDSLTVDETYNRVVIEALNKKNTDSGGEEVWLTDVVVNGESIDLVDAFGDSWIEKDGILIWRPYDQKVGMTEVISAEFEPGDIVKLEFQSNQWRGIAKVSCGGQEEILDSYSDTASDSHRLTWETVVSEPKTEGMHFFSKGAIWKMLSVLVFLILISWLISCVRKKDYRSKMDEDSIRYIWMDALKAISAFMIVVIHSSGNVYNNFFGQDMVIWMKALWINSIPRFAVPCFLMITGALVLDKTYDYDKVLWKKIQRILIPLFFWSATYVVARRLLWHDNDNFVEEILKIPFMNQDGSLWYAYQLFWLYLGLPVWQRLYQLLSVKLRWGFVWFALGIPGILTMIGEIAPFNVPEYLPFASIAPEICYVGILFLGKMLVESFAQRKISIWVAESVSLIAIGLGTMVVCSIYSGNLKGVSVHTYFSEVRLSALCYGAGIFMLFCYMSVFFQKLPKVLKYIISGVSKVSLGIYFSHCLILCAFSDISIGGVHIVRDSGSIKQLLICISIYYMIALTGCFVVSKIPGLKRLVI